MTGHTLSKEEKAEVMPDLKEHSRQEYLIKREK